ncbi:cyp3a90-like protein [Aphelenchoides avenae]|nr:cyp3a90-like protein [Aphelenchus avenae]
MTTLGIGDRLLLFLVMAAAFAFTFPLRYSILMGVTTLAAALVYLWYTRTYWERIGIPTASCSILLDNTHKLLKDGLHYDIVNFQKLGNTYGDYTFGCKNVVSMDLDLLKTVFVKEFAHFEDFIFGIDNTSKSQKDSLMANNLSFVSGEQWKRIRNQITPALTTGKMRKLIPMLERCVEDLCRYVDSTIETKTEIPIASVMGSLSMDMIARTAYAVDIHAYDASKPSPFMQNAKKFFDQMPVYFTFIICFPYLIEKVRDFFGIDLLMTSPLKFFQDVLEGLYERRKSDPEASKKYNDLFQMMLDATEEPTNGTNGVDRHSLGTKGLTKIELLSQSVGIMSAGYETTGVLLNFALYHIAKLPEIQERLHAEIEEVVGESDHVTYDHITNMHYLNQVICETLRFYPPGYRSGRRCSAPITLKGIPFEKGTVVVLPIYTIHHNPEFYENPEVFDPERFTAEKRAQRDPMTFVPFGYGPRMCLGMRLAEFEARIALSVLLRRYRFHPGKDGPELPLEMSPLTGFGTLKPKHELRVIAERR